MNKCKDESELQIGDDKLKSLVDEIESELFRFHNRDPGPKYKNKYRSLVFNIKDEKNNGLFRKILGRKVIAHDFVLFTQLSSSTIFCQISPKNLVTMSPEDLANKELQQWRQAELKQDIEKIKAHELDMISLGNKYVIKSHKGEQVIEDDADDGKAKAKVAEVRLPDDIDKEKRRKHHHSSHRHHHHHKKESRRSKEVSTTDSRDAFVLRSLNH